MFDYIIANIEIKIKYYNTCSSGDVTACILSCIILQYSSDSSTPIESNPSSFAAMRVVPDPAKGSNTVPPLGVISLMRYFINSRFLTVGWSFSIVRLCVLSLTELFVE